MGWASRDPSPAPYRVRVRVRVRVRARVRVRVKVRVRVRVRVTCADGGLCLPMADSACDEVRGTSVVSR